MIDGTLAAVLASEHVLFIGPPGTAKSALCRAFASAFEGRQVYSLLMSDGGLDERGAKALVEKLKGSS